MSFKIKINEKESIHVTMDTANEGSKIFMIPCVGTSCLANPRCLKSMNKGGEHICSQCYASVSQKRYANLKKCLLKNTDILKRPLETEEVKAIANQLRMYSYVRFESHGDLNSLHQYVNYCKIACQCESTKFVLFTKNLCYVRKGIKPSNMTLIYSNPWINKEMDKSSLERLREFADVDYVFSVYRKKEDIPKNNFQCKKQCYNCLKCWESTDNIETIGELLK